MAPTGDWSHAILCFVWFVDSGYLRMGRYYSLLGSPCPKYADSASPFDAVHWMPATNPRKGKLCRWSHRQFSLAPAARWTTAGESHDRFAVFRYAGHLN